MSSISDVLRIDTDIILLVLAIRKKTFKLEVDVMCPNGLCSFAVHERIPVSRSCQNRSAYLVSCELMLFRMSHLS